MEYEYGFKWIKDNLSFNDKDSNKVTINWGKEPFEDLKRLSREYFDCANDVTNHIQNNPNDNEKCDFWFLPVLYMFRHSLELMLKAILYKEIKTKLILQEIFLEAKHNLSALYTKYKLNATDIRINKNENKWIEDYFKDIENIDRNSDLFRYPFGRSFIEAYGNNFLDISKISENFLLAYAILNKCDNGKGNEEIYHINTERKSNFIYLAHNMRGNCFIWNSRIKPKFHSHFRGYSSVASFLFSRRDIEDDGIRIYPIAFLLRNAIELGLKRLLDSNTVVQVSDHKRNKIKNSHLLYKDLWKNVKDMLFYYAEQTNEDIDTLYQLEKHIIELSKLDKNGDVFRYPFSFSFEYKFDKKYKVVEHIYKLMLNMCYLIEGCHYMLETIYEYECET